MGKWTFWQDNERAWLDAHSQKLRDQLKAAGFSKAAIDAAWPSWWSDEAAASASARAELRFGLARKLGLSARSLIGERVDFAWDDLARFKHLTTETDNQKAALSSFGVALGRMLLRGGEEFIAERLPAETIREAILAHSLFVDLGQLLAFSWAIGIPVIHVRVFPLASKSMHAMAVRVGDKYAILLGKDDQYPAPVAFTLAHELGHILLGHLEGETAIVDLEAPVGPSNGDTQEEEANAFAMELLTGSSKPEIVITGAKISSRSLASAALGVGLEYRIEPGTLALCAGHVAQRWDAAFGALKYIYPAKQSLWEQVNSIAEGSIRWDALSDDSTEYLYNILQLRYE